MCYCFRTSMSTSSTFKAVIHPKALYITGQKPQILTFLSKLYFTQHYLPQRKTEKTVQLSGYTGNDIHWSELMDKHRFQESLLHFSDSDVICYLICPLSNSLSSGLTKCSCFSTRHRDEKYNYNEKCKH